MVCQTHCRAGGFPGHIPGDDRVLRHYGTGRLDSVLYMAGAAGHAGRVDVQGTQKIIRAGAGVGAVKKQLLFLDKIVNK